MHKMHPSAHVPIILCGSSVINAHNYWFFFSLLFFFYISFTMPLPHNPASTPNTSYLTASHCHSHTYIYIYCTMTATQNTVTHIYTHALDGANNKYPHFPACFQAAVCDWTGKRGAVKDKGQHFTNCWCVWEEGGSKMIGCVVFCRMGGVACNAKKTHKSMHPQTERHICMHAHMLIPRTSSEVMCGYKQGSWTTAWAVTYFPAP